MRLPVEIAGRILALSLSAGALAGCALVEGSERRAGLVSAPVPASTTVGNGPAADYPMVLGEPFTVDGELYTPADVMNYDAVGYAALDPQGGAGATIAHKTLPLPSYVEITALDSGRTILARVERRGPMSGRRLVALSRGAQTQLGVSEGAPVRVRRVNPPELERAELRAGRLASERMEMPRSLADVLRRKLPDGGPAALRTASTQPSGLAPQESAPVAAPSTPASSSAPTASVYPRPATAYPLPPLASAPRPPVPGRPVPLTARSAETVESQQDGFVIQAAAFSSKANAERAAATLNGFVSPAGRFFRVRTGPYATRGEAEDALAKVRAAGYSDARVFTAG